MRRIAIAMFVGLVLFWLGCANKTAVSDHDSPEEVIAKIKSGEIQTYSTYNPKQEMADLECQQMAVQVNPHGGTALRYTTYLRCMRAKGY